MDQVSRSDLPLLHQSQINEILGNISELKAQSKSEGCSCVQCVKDVLKGLCPLNNFKLVFGLNEINLVIPLSKLCSNRTLDIKNVNKATSKLTTMLAST